MTIVICILPVCIGTAILRSWTVHVCPAIWRVWPVGVIVAMMSVAPAFASDSDRLLMSMTSASFVSWLRTIICFDAMSMIVVVSRPSPVSLVRADLQPLMYWVMSPATAPTMPVPLPLLFTVTSASAGQATAQAKQRDPKESIGCHVRSSE